MSLSPLLLERIAYALAEHLGGAQPGHCVRVDNLDRGDATTICQRLRNGLLDNQTQAFILDGSSEDDPLHMQPERAIEYRNRKLQKLVLFFPADFVDAASSSLTNSFAAFDLEGCIRSASDSLLRGLPDNVRNLARQALAVLRGTSKPAPERRADYLGALAADPTEQRAGAELWRIGLIPDFGEGFTNRLETNRHCVQELCRPARAQTSAEERIDALGLLRGAVRDNLVAYFSSKRLRDLYSWLPQFAEAPEPERLSFERWTFESAASSDLERIEMQPLVDSNGCVEKYTKLTQPGGAGNQPQAAVAPKSKMTVKWKAFPSSPTNLKRWLAELIPSREEYAEDEYEGADLPYTRVSSKMRQASISLDFDLESVNVRAAQVRVVALDEHDNYLLDRDGRIIEGISDEFFLLTDAPGPERGNARTTTTPTLPLARLKAAIDLKCEELEETPGQWVQKDLNYYSVTHNNRVTSRIGVSSVLRAIEERSLDHPFDCGPHQGVVEASETLDPTQVRYGNHLTPFQRDEAVSSFLARRRDLFAQLNAQGPRRLAETVDWTPELATKARKYAKAYRELLGRASDPAILQAVLDIDALHLTLEQTSGPEEAVLLLPLHPLRMLWYSSYAELCRSWEDQLLKSTDDRRKLLDYDLLARVAPLNCPAFTRGPRGQACLFTQNLRFFWGLALPIDAKDPGRRTSDVSRAVGLPEEESSVADLPPRRLAEEFQAYRTVHSYLDVLRLNILNPGSGGFLSDALRSLYDSTLRPGEDEDELPPPKLEILVHAHEPVPVRIPALADLQRDLYEAQPRGRRHHLSPFFSMALRPLRELGHLPGGDVHLTVSTDETRPVVQHRNPVETLDSSSFYGLLFRLVARFASAEAGSNWQHTMSLPAASPREKHPVTSSYTSEMVDTHRDFLSALSRLAGGSGPNSLPTITVELSPEDRLRTDHVHNTSDWVISLDRFLGVDFFDAPRDPHLHKIGRRYLLDYAPEFLEGLGHRMLVTTAHREEVEEVLSNAMRNLGFDQVDSSVGEVLSALKTISGRLALRIVGDDSRAREVVALGAVSAWLRSQGELDDAILIPVDAHPELFAPQGRRKEQGTTYSRCDLIRVRLTRKALVATFIEVKSRTASAPSDELMEQIADQVESTERVFRDLFFREIPVRLDHVLQRSRLATILRFYLRRAERYGLFTSHEALAEADENLARLELGIPELRAHKRGYVVNLAGSPQKPTKTRDTAIHFLTGIDFAEAGLSSEFGTEARSKRGRSRADRKPTPAADPSAATGPDDISLLGTNQTAEDACNLDDTTSAMVDSEFPQATTSEPPALHEDDGGGSPPGLPLGASPEIDEAPGHPPQPPPSQPTAIGGTVNICLGVTVGSMTPVNWMAGVKGSPHLFLLGIPGQGKSWTVTRLLCELQRQGLPALVIDFHGQFGAPIGSYARLANPAVLDASRGLPFSPFEASVSRSAGTSFWQTNCFSVAEIFQYVCEMGDIQRDVVYEALRDCYLDLGFDNGSPRRIPTVAEVSQRLAEVEENRGVKNVVPRCRPLLELGLFTDDHAGQSDLQDLLRRGLVLDVHSLGLETLQLAAGAFLLRKLYKDMFTWGEADRLRLAIVLDEAHRLAHDITLPKIMKEGRKFGLAVIVASQGLADYHPDVVGNAGTKVVFRTNFPTSKKVAGFLRARKGVDLAAAIEQLEVGEAYVQTPEMATCAKVRMNPLDY